MEKAHDLIKVYSGTEASVILLKDRLEETGISSLIKNDSSSAFFGATPPVIDLYIQESDIKEARSVITDFNKNNKV